MSYGELLFGNIAIQFRYATVAQVEKALELQAGPRADLPLGEILIQLQHITPEQREEIVQAQFQSKVKPANTKFGKLVVVNGFISQKDLFAVVEKQKMYLAKTGKLPPLGKLLIKEKKITLQQKNAIISIQHRLNRQANPSGSSASNDALEIMHEEVENDAERVTAADFKVGEDERSCPACKSIIYRALTFCPHCKIYFCQRCSGELDREKRFCLDCGTFVQGQAPKVLKRTQRHSPIAQAFAGGFLVVAVFVGIFLLNKITNSEPLPKITEIKQDGDLDTLNYDIKTLITIRKFPEAEENLTKFRQTLSEKTFDAESRAYYENTLDSLASALNEARILAKKEEDSKTNPQDTGTQDSGSENRVMTPAELIKKAQYLKDLGEFGKAAATLAELNTRPERTWHSFYLAGEIALKQEKADQAIRFFEQAREMGGEDFSEKELSDLFDQLLPLYSPIHEASQIVRLLEPFTKRNETQHKLLAYSYWSLGEKEKCWDLLFNTQSIADLKCQVLLAEYALAHKKPEMLQSIMNFTSEELKVRFLDYGLWYRWKELLTSTDRFVKVFLTSGKEYQGKVLEENTRVYKIEYEKDKNITVSKSQVSQLEELPNPDYVLFEQFLKERSAIAFNNISENLALARKYIESPTLKPFAIALLVRFEDDDPEAFELIRENGFQVDEGAFIHHSLINLKRSLEFSPQVRVTEGTLKPIETLLQFYPESVYLLYFKAAVLGELRKSKEAIETANLIAPTSKLKKLGELKGYLQYQLRIYCGICYGKAESCPTCSKRGFVYSDCPVCKGMRRHPDPKKKNQACPKCLGSGRQEDSCPSCKGDKFVTCSNCGSKPGEPLPEYSIKRANFFVEEELAQFLKEGTILRDLVFPKPSFRY